jgi:glyoxylase-like metal-dependent hydrolase (beta-lactamase superfamily II)
MRLFGNLYAYVWQGSDNNCNSYVFAHALEGGKNVVVDPGHLVTPYYRESGLERLLEGMEKDGIAQAGIGLVILTHGHPDHCESAIVIRNEYQSLVAIHRADEPFYSALGGKADLFLDEGNLELGTEKPTSIQVYHSPGHTPGHVTLYWPAHGALIAGDCIFFRSTGRADLPGGDARALKTSIEKLSRLPIDHLLCGHPYGHPGIISGRQEVQDNFEYIKHLFY